MMFRRTASAAKANEPRGSLLLRASAVAGFLCMSLMPQGQAQAQNPMAVIPTRTIYPGEVIESHQVEAVEVTNPNLTGDYASAINQVAGKITSRTLLAGRVILTSALRDPYTVERGKAVRIVFNNGPLTITAAGSPLESAAIGDLIRVRNTDSGVIVSGTVMADGTIHVVAK
ncbi:flagellar basal body P-ring formation chaperone FlgA [Pararhizobium antarcticum]|uniref:Flagella basal body P-ring formation protein FlgA n=1 Tax=Pararhizobium antarcticum TaxID=1798805 RepID=A0A657LRK5_9HYPH|nr:flagellar basal body P-ring formation chaperone FlgA [Pararhizobium antarcticum]OJF94292.1 flagellar biosynthesis protein FlgA [Rhizobium sp. 58]OJF96320.1 flagellar biosynthesis protein FlgA [Pararhizobium antarcticum]